ncbi:MAG: phosphoenolpyruvate--protein phosphotransferase [Negativicutes bacterium]|nr:phosphoenolpyruvate--protein phosphotransferase [Negativicutes bacterium]
MISGIPGSQGIAIGKAVIYAGGRPVIDRQAISPDQAEGEQQKLLQAVEASKEQLSCIRCQAMQEAGEESAAIFDAHIAMLDDPALLDDIKGLIECECCTAACAAETVIAQFSELFEAMEDEYMKERAADIRDIGNRLLRNLTGNGPENLDAMEGEVIVIAHDLTPSDTLAMDKTHVRGFAANIGGKTSHAAILARTLGIPAVLGLGDATEKVTSGQVVVLDGTTGVLIVAPDESQLAEYRQRQKASCDKEQQLQQLISLPAVTTDGRRVEIAANIGTPQDVAAVIANGGEGVGLFRTEFLYMGRAHLPSEEEQYTAYKSVLEGLDGRPVIIRTLDIGGDKELACFSFPREANPFLGWRAIRFCLAERDIFKTQLKAILRASIFGNALIMYPMISGVDEVWAANAVLAEAKEELRVAGVPFAQDIPVGIMVEIPSAAITADIIAPHVDFFSIGTNDLCQYTLAVDRMNEKIGDLYQPLHPAVLRLIKNVVEVARRNGKFTGMCGEMAGDPMATIILLGLGLDEFSMSASAMLRIKKIITSVSYQQAQKIATEALAMATPAQINEYAAKKLCELGLSDL